MHYVWRVFYPKAEAFKRFQGRFHLFKWNYTFFYTTFDAFFTSL